MPQTHTRHSGLFSSECLLLCLPWKRICFFFNLTRMTNKILNNSIVANCNTKCARMINLLQHDKLSVNYKWATKIQFLSQAQHSKAVFPKFLNVRRGRILDLGSDESWNPRYLVKWQRLTLSMTHVDWSYLLALPRSGKYVNIRDLALDYVKYWCCVHKNLTPTGRR